MSAGPRAAVLAATLFLVACGGPMPDGLGVTMDRLAPCPDSPNCVNTGDRHPDPMEPLNLLGSVDRATAMSRIQDVVTSFPRTEVVTADGPYLHVTFKSFLFRFVDDVELLLRDDGELVVRSASRVGRSDLGANERRVERIRIALTDAGLIE